MSDIKTDWLGQEYGPDDLVIYAAMSGRSCNMVLARVVKIGAKTVTVAPVKGARWKQHGGRTRYIDTRTGKGIDPYAGNHKGIKRDSGYVHKVTGEYRSWEQIREIPSEHRYTLYEYTPALFHDWVQVVHPEQQVILQVTDNITKWSGKYDRTFDYES